MKIVWIFCINKLLIWLISYSLGDSLIITLSIVQISKVLFKIVHGYSPFPPDIYTSASAESFAQHIHDLCAVIRWKIALSIENYKLSFGTHCRNK
jgi:hypothetical protein